MWLIHEYETVKQTFIRLKCLFMAPNIVLRSLYFLKPEISRLMFLSQGIDWKIEFYANRSQGQSIRSAFRGRKFLNYTWFEKYQYKWTEDYKIMIHSVIDRWNTVLMLIYFACPKFTQGYPFFILLGLSHLLNWLYILVASHDSESLSSYMAGPESGFSLNGALIVISSHIWNIFWYIKYVFSRKRQLEMSTFYFFLHIFWIKTNIRRWKSGNTCWLTKTAILTSENRIFILNHNFSPNRVNTCVHLCIRSFF